MTNGSQEYSVDYILNDVDKTVKTTLFFVINEHKMCIIIIYCNYLFLTKLIKSMFMWQKQNVRFYIGDKVWNSLIVQKFGLGENITKMSYCLISALKKVQECRILTIKL